MNKIKLGDKVKDKITGFTGTAVARTEYINGCIQIEVQPTMTDKNKKEMIIPESLGVDIQTLEKIKAKSIKIKKSDVGGPSRKPISMRGF